LEHKVEKLVQNGGEVFCKAVTGDCDSLLYRTYNVILKKKSKVILLHAWCGPEGG